MKPRKLRKWKMWVGFSDDRPDFDTNLDGISVNPYGSIYKTRAKALDRYQDVRRVEISTLPRKRRRK